MIFLFTNHNGRFHRRGFTLVELLIVVSILGILAAIVLPEFQNHVQLAKEAAAKDNLRILRDVIERYAIEHNNVAPGYTNNDPTDLPAGFEAHCQLVDEGYLKDIPENPLNNDNSIWAFFVGGEKPAFAADDTTGWMYDPAHRIIRLNTSGNDSQGVPYFSY